MSGTEILNELNDVYKEECSSRSFVFKWVAEFKRGRENAIDENCGGRPSEIGDSKQLAIEALIGDNRRVSVRDLAASSKIGYGTCQELIKGLGVRKLASRIVPKFLTGEMMEKRVQCCEENFALFNEHGETFLFNIVTEDETPLSSYLPKFKRESAEWKFTGEQPTKKLRAGTSHRCSQFSGMRVELFWWILLLN